VDLAVVVVGMVERVVQQQLVRVMPVERERQLNTVEEVVVVQDQLEHQTLGQQVEMAVLD
jgi:hypothetical protein